MSIDYKSAGVDIEAGEETVSRIKSMVKETFNPKVLSDIGLFGGMYDAKFEAYDHPVLVASTDGVGTKLKVAFAMNKHNTVGQCLVNHCVDDILCCGAKPLFFLDYFATGKLNPDVAVDVISGFATACKQNGAALIGGETAEMPSIYADGEYDMSGTIVGVVEKSKVLNGSQVQKGDILIGLQSSGLHTNGYSLARKVFENKISYDTYIDDLGTTLGDAMLNIHISYLNSVKPLLDNNLLNGISHITGGGIVGNTLRIVTGDKQLIIDWESWQLPPLFELIKSTGKISIEEMRKVFNLGIGMILVTNEVNVDSILNSTQIHNPKVIGRIG